MDATITIHCSGCDAEATLQKSGPSALSVELDGWEAGDGWLCLDCRSNS